MSADKFLVPWQVGALFLLLFGWWRADHLRVLTRSDILTLAAVWLLGAVVGFIAWKSFRQRRLLSLFVFGLNVLGLVAVCMIIWSGKLDVH
jgi:hypothetical protein